MNENELTKTAQLQWKQGEEERDEMAEMLFSLSVKVMLAFSEDSKMFGTSCIFFE